MLKIEKENRRLISLQQLHLTPASSGERYDLREFLLNSPGEFFSEIHNNLFVIGADIRPSPAAPVDIDMLALDGEGCAVVVIIEREEEQSALVRGITAAGMIAGWATEEFLRRLPQERVDQLRQFLSSDLSRVNHKQRIIFVAETYDFESLTAASWLAQRGIDIFCVRVSRANGFQTDGDYLWCTQVTAPGSAQASLLLKEGSAGFEVWVGEAVAHSQVSEQELAKEIEARRQAEQSLRASEERYWTLARLSPVGIFHTDAEGSMLYVNDRWCEMAGLTQQEAQGQGWARGLHSDDRDRVLNHWHEATEQGMPFKAEFRFQRPDGGTSWVLGEAAVQKDDKGQVTGYVGTVTELHRVDAARGGSMAAGIRR